MTLVVSPLARHRETNLMRGGHTIGGRCVKRDDHGGGSGRGHVVLDADDLDGLAADLLLEGASPAGGGHRQALNVGV